jgi:hypothetical protein
MSRWGLNLYCMLSRMPSTDPNETHNVSRGVVPLAYTQMRLGGGACGVAFGHAGREPRRGWPDEIPRWISAGVGGGKAFRPLCDLTSRAIGSNFVADMRHHHISRLSRSAELLTATTVQAAIVA